MFRLHCIADFAGKRQTPGARGVVWGVVRGVGCSCYESLSCEFTLSGVPEPSFPRRRESRSVSTETYRVKRFLEIFRSGFPLLWE
ncbi:hypothetical protein CIF91_08775 [Neisseria gonorrhoeae]